MYLLHNLSPQAWEVGVVRQREGEVVAVVGKERAEAVLADAVMLGAQASTTTSLPIGISFTTVKGRCDRD